MVHTSLLWKSWLLVAMVGCASQGGVARDTRALFVVEHPDVSPKFTEAILAGNVLIGMTGDMVQAAWGKPTRVEKTISNADADEKWIYGNYLVSSAVTHLYFSKGELVLYEFVDTKLQVSTSITDPNQKLSLSSRAPSQTETDGGTKNGPN